MPLLPAVAAWFAILVLAIADGALREAGFDRLVQGKPWPALRAAFTFKDGNLGPMVLVAVLVAPPLCLHALGGRARRDDAQEAGE